MKNFGVKLLEVLDELGGEGDFGDEEDDGFAAF